MRRRRRRLAKKRRTRRRQLRRANDWLIYWVAPGIAEMVNNANPLSDVFTDAVLADNTKWTHHPRSLALYH